MLIIVCIILVLAMVCAKGDDTDFLIYAIIGLILAFFLDNIMLGFLLFNLATS
jgi:multisubunit Na+/H+ antiporter MnhB subunit